MELRQLDEYGEQSPEMSLAVKLAFSRVCSLIYSLKNDIGEEAASYQLLRIRNDVDKVLKVSKNRGVFKENRLPHFSELDTTSTTVKTKGTQNFIAQSNVSGRRECLQPYNGNASYFGAKNEIVNGHSFTNRLEGKESGSKYQQNNGAVSSFFSSKNDDLCTSFSSSFRPMVRTTSSDAENCVSLGTIVEEDVFQIDESDEESGSEEQANKESPFFFLKSWSILLQDKEMVLTGIKMNEKGEILEKNFVSKKVMTRKQKDTVKTLDGEFVLQGNLIDKNKVIPDEVKNQYFDSDPFPRFWRQALRLWIELEDKKKKEEKSKKKISPQKKMKDDTTRKRSISPQKKMKDVNTRKRSISPKKKMKDVSTRKRSISPKKKAKDVGTRKRSISPKKKMKDVSTRKRSVSPKKKMAKKEMKKSPAPSASKHDLSQQNKKTNDKAKRNTKKNKQASNSENHDNHNPGKNGVNKNLENGQEEHGPFSELLGDSLMLFPASSLTPNGLLGSIKKNVIKGRYTPPTSMFDNVYGTKNDNNSSVNTSFDDIGAKNNPVVKRMCNVNKKPKGRQNHKSPKNKHIIEEDEAINEILRAAKSKTNTTPSIMKQVFSAETAEDSVSFSDLSDIEVA